MMLNLLSPFDSKPVIVVSGTVQRGRDTRVHPGEHHSTDQYSEKFTRCANGWGHQ